MASKCDSYTQRRVRKSAGVNAPKGAACRLNLRRLIAALAVAVAMLVVLPAHAWATAEQNVLVSTSDGVSTVESSGTTLMNDASTQTKAAYDLTGKANTPTIGEARVLAFLVSFPNDPDVRCHSFAEGDTVEALQALIGPHLDGTAPSMSAPGPYGSLNDYYYRSSYGKLSFKGEVYAYEATKARDEYVDKLGTVKKLVAEVLQAFDDSIDYSNYDGDGDKKIDCVYIHFAGPYQASGEKYTWWSYLMKGLSFLKFEGGTMGIGSGVMLREPSNNGEIASKTIIHETGHALGQTDLYAHPSSGHPGNEYGLATADIMNSATGDHNGFTKWLYGWLNDDNVIKVSANENGVTATRGQAKVGTQNADGTLTLELAPYVDADDTSKTGGVIVIANEAPKSVIGSNYYLLEYDARAGNMAPVFSEDSSDDRGLRLFRVTAESSGNGFSMIGEKSQTKYENMGFDFHHQLIECVNPSEDVWDPDYDENDVSTSFLPQDFTITPTSAPSTNFFETLSLGFTGITLHVDSTGDDKAVVTIGYDGTAAPNSWDGTLTMTASKDDDAYVSSGKFTLTLQANVDDLSLNGGERVAGQSLSYRNKGISLYSKGKLIGFLKGTVVIEGSTVTLNMSGLDTDALAGLKEEATLVFQKGFFSVRSEGDSPKVSVSVPVVHRSSPQQSGALADTHYDSDKLPILSPVFGEGESRHFYRYIESGEYFKGESLEDDTYVRYDFTVNNPTVVNEVLLVGNEWESEKEIAQASIDEIGTDDSEELSDLDVEGTVRQLSDELKGKNWVIYTAKIVNDQIYVVMFNRQESMMRVVSINQSIMEIVGDSSEISLGNLDVANIDTVSIIPGLQGQIAVTLFRVYGKELIDHYQATYLFDKSLMSKDYLDGYGTGCGCWLPDGRFVSFGVRIDPYRAPYADINEEGNDITEYGCHHLSYDITKPLIPKQHQVTISRADGNVVGIEIDGTPVETNAKGKFAISLTEGSHIVKVTTKEGYNRVAWTWNTSLSLRGDAVFTPDESDSKLGVLQVGSKTLSLKATAVKTTHRITFAKTKSVQYYKAAEGYELHTDKNDNFYIDFDEVTEYTDVNGTKIYKCSASDPLYVKAAVTSGCLRAKWTFAQSGTCLGGANFGVDDKGKVLTQFTGDADQEEDGTFMAGAYVYGGTKDLTVNAATVKTTHRITLSKIEGVQYYTDDDGNRLPTKENGSAYIDFDEVTDYTDDDGNEVYYYDASDPDPNPFYVKAVLDLGYMRARWSFTSRGGANFGIDDEGEAITKWDDYTYEEEDSTFTTWAPIYVGVKDITAKATPIRTTHRITLSKVTGVQYYVDDEGTKLPTKSNGSAYVDVDEITSYIDTNGNVIYGGSVKVGAVMKEGYNKVKWSFVTGEKYRGDAKLSQTGEIKSTNGDCVWNEISVVTKNITVQAAGTLTTHTVSLSKGEGIDHFEDATGNKVSSVKVDEVRSYTKINGTAVHGPGDCVYAVQKVGYSGVNWSFTTKESKLKGASFGTIKQGDSVSVLTSLKDVKAGADGRVAAPLYVGSASVSVKATAIRFAYVLTLTKGTLPKAAKDGVDHFEVNLIDANQSEEATDIDNTDTISVAPGMSVAVPEGKKAHVKVIMSDSAKDAGYATVTWSFSGAVSKLAGANLGMLGERAITKGVRGNEVTAHIGTADVTLHAYPALTRHSLTLTGASGVSSFTVKRADGSTQTLASGKKLEEGVDEGDIVLIGISLSSDAKAKGTNAATWKITTANPQGAELLRATDTSKVSADNPSALTSNDKVVFAQVKMGACDLKVKATGTTATS